MAKSSGLPCDLVQHLAWSISRVPEPRRQNDGYWMVHGSTLSPAGGRHRPHTGHRRSA